MENILNSNVDIRQNINESQQIQQELEYNKQQNTKIAETSALLSGIKNQGEHFVDQFYDAFTMGQFGSKNTEFDFAGRKQVDLLI